MTISPPIIESQPRLPRAERRERTGELFRSLDAATDSIRRDELREQITALNMCVAESVARRYRGRGEIEDDLRQVAYLGLLKAVNGFDNGYHKDFLTYAVPTITGELKKHFRDHCWTVRPPRRIQDLQSKIAAMIEELSQKYDHPPTTPEVADALDVGPGEVPEALSANGCFTPSSLDAEVGHAGSTMAVGDRIGGDDHGFDAAETHLLLATVVRELSERDRDVIELRFFHEWTQERIARELGITQIQVSRMIARIMRDLRASIDEPPSGTRCA